MEETTESVSQAVHLTDANFAAEVLNFKGVVLVDFWAEWCGPCHVMGPRVDELAAKHAGNEQVKIAKLDVDSNEETSMEQRVLSLPTFKLFKDGEVIDELIGSAPPEVLEQMLTRNLPAA